MHGIYWLASYPKSGNTWLRLFLENLLDNGNSFDLNNLRFTAHNAAERQRFDRILDICSSDLTDDEIANARPRQFELEAAAATAPLLYKTHDAWRLTPAGEPLFPPAVTRGVVYLVRDPRDVAISMAHHMGQSVDQIIVRMANPQAVMERASIRMPGQLPQLLTTWSGHAASWLSAPVPLLLLKYEEMLADPIISFGKAAGFLGYKRTPEQIRAAVEAVRFERLQEMEETTGFGEKPPQAERFFRRGITGGWRDSLTPEQAGRITADHGEMMRLFGYLA